MSYKSNIIKWSALPKDTENELHSPSKLAFVTVDRPSNFRTGGNKSRIQRHAVSEGKVRQKNLQERWRAHLQRGMIDTGALEAMQLPQEQCPIPVQPYMSDLIRYFRTFLFPEWNDHNTMRRLYSTTAAQSPGVFHCILYAAAAHQDGRSGREPRRLTLFHESASLEILREMVQNAQQSNYLEILLSSMIHRNFSDMEGREEVREMHEKAVEYMLSVWDEAENQETRVVFRRMIRTGELRRAVSNGVTPVWLNSAVDQSALPIVNEALSTIDDEAQNPMSLLDDEQKAANIVRKLINNTGSLQYLHQQPSDLDVTALAEIRESLTGYVNAMQGTFVGFNLTDASSMTQLYSLASMIFCRSLFYSIPMSMPIHEKLLSQMMTPATTVFDQGAWQHEPLLYLWVCMLMTASSRFKPRPDCIRPIFAVIIMNVGIEEKWCQHVEKLVQNFLWIQQLLEQRQTNLWGLNDNEL